MHADAQSDMAEVLTVMGRAAFTHQHLEEWMAPDPRETDPNLHGSARAAISYQPKGVVGNMSPWNFPFDLSLGPLVDMLAAGNRAILKPSEYTPACSELLREMVSATFDRDLVAVVTGGLELAKEFPDLALGPPALHRQHRGRAADREGGRREPGARDARSWAARARCSCSTTAWMRTPSATSSARR